MHVVNKERQERRQGQGDLQLLDDLKYLDRLDIAVRLRRNGYYDLAQTVAEDLSIVRPEESSVWHTLGQISNDKGEFGKSLEYHQRAFRLLQKNGVENMKQIQTSSLGLAQALMRFGRFEEALPLWEAGRLQVSWSPYWPGCKYWNGSDPLPDSLLVQSEGGYGDTFMFSRWLPLLKSQAGVRKVGLMLWPPLADFCDWKALGIDEIYRIGEDTIRFEDYRFATSIMSLPAIFGVKSWNDIPMPQEPKQEQEHPETINGPARLGFCWRAEENMSPVRTKSLPWSVASEIARELSIDFKVFSLSPCKSDLYSASEFVQPTNTIVEPERMSDWRATAEYLLSMDYVLTVDTAVAHLCGLLGVPALVLLPCASCWRWATPSDAGAHGTLWYGDHIKVYRQRQPLDWNATEIVQAFAGIIR